MRIYLRNKVTLVCLNQLSVIEKNSKLDEECLHAQDEGPARAGCAGCAGSVASPLLNVYQRWS